jgi:hypothetical protein
MNADAPVVDSLVTWGIVCKEFPFQLYGEAKELPIQNWYDSHGAEEYVPPSLYISAYDLSVEFAYKGTAFSANTAIRGFLNYLTGNDGLGHGAELSVYDTYTRIGRQRVRFLSVENDLIVRNTAEGDVFVFTIHFRVNDPVTDVLLN